MAVIYVAFAGIFVAGSEYMVRHLIIPRSGYEAFRAHVNTETADAVAFGDSRVARGIVDAPDLASLAYPGTKLSTSLDMIEDYHQRQPIRTLVLQLDPHQFSPYRLNRDQRAWRDDLLQHTVPALAMLRAPYRQYLFSYWKSLPRYFRRAKTVTSSGKSTIPRVSEKPADSEKRAAQIRANQQTPVVGFRQTPLARRLVAMLNRFSASGTQLCLVGFPVSNAYREATADNVPIAQTRRFFQETAQSVGAVYLDMWDRYDDTLLANADHLNVDGAKKLTAEIRRACLDQNR